MKNKVKVLPFPLIMASVLPLFFTALDSRAQIRAPAAPASEYLNSTSFGVSYGEQNDRDADFYGFSIDYARLFSPRWIIGTALTWDREEERFSDKPDKQVDSYTLVGTISYALTDRLSLTTGLGKGFANDDNKKGKLEFANGSLGTGVALGYGLPSLLKSKRDAIGLSVAYEYNITDRETSVSFDISFGFSF